MRRSGLLLMLMTASLLPATAEDRGAPLAAPATVANQTGPKSATDRGLSGSRRLWRISLAGVAAANALDVHSSWGKREQNGALAGANGRFGGRGLALKASMQAGMVAAERLLLGRHRGRPIARPASRTSSSRR